MLLMRSAKFTPAVPATYISAKAGGSSVNAANESPATNVPVINDLFVCIPVTPSRHHTKSLVDTTPRKNRAASDDDEWAAIYSVSLHTDDAKCFAMCELLRITNGGFLQMAAFHRPGPLGLPPVSVLHPHAIEVVLRAFSKMPVT